MDISLILPFLLLLLFIPLFMSGRRQRRQMQEMKDLQGALEPGDVVMTTSGLRATVVDASYEETVDLEIADGVVSTWVRAAIRERISPAVEEIGSDATDATDGDAASLGTSSRETSLETPSSEKTSLEKPSLEKDDSANGTTRA